ncbi:MAG: hypothetical protein P4L99_06165 [Chthoniobacter sp.]|nr:hypothetical protein [Chthoniobacter sp.]
MTRLHFRAREEGIPTTRLANRFIEEALAHSDTIHEHATPRAAEDPPTATVPG